jgi:Ion channel
MAGSSSSGRGSSGRRPGGRIRRRDRHLPAYFRMLWGILLAYALIISLGDNRVSSAARVILLSYLLWTSARLHSDRRWRKWALVLAAAAFIATGSAALVASNRDASGVVGGSSVLLISVSIAATVSKLLLKSRVDIETVLGVLCVYLMLALLFASINQVFAVFQSPYLNGLHGSPTASDLLYFSVITLATVGYGDISPATQVARAVSVLEALTGQLYLVSVVAGVVAGWRAGEGPRENPDA